MKISSNFNFDKKENDLVIALAGNPNVGKSTIFNQLTGLNQHTGNWPGKTVTNAWGKYIKDDRTCFIVDLPGTYSLFAHSAEEEVARDFICSGEPDIVVVVCDATSLERNMNLVLQTLEITNQVIVCVNLMDEAKKKNIKIDLKKLETKLGVPVFGTTARSNKGLDELITTIFNKQYENKDCLKITYSPLIEEAIALLEPVIERKTHIKINARFLSLKLLSDEENLNTIDCFSEDEEIINAIKEAKNLVNNNLSKEELSDEIITNIINQAHDICDYCLEDENDDNKQRKIDKFLTNKWTGIPIMLILLAFIFWLSITLSNYPSDLLSKCLFYIEAKLADFLFWIHVPNWLCNMLVYGIYRVLAWVIAVMLPPMAIFFPLFTLLEDVGYLPRIAFNLDKFFKKCSACGKQALTMCMGFGCNAVGVTGARIIDSPRERLIAIITNNFVPCNGRFPILIAIISMFFISNIAGFQSLAAGFFLTLIIIFGILMTFLVSKILSLTILKGLPSSFILELPPYRKPQIGKVIIRSILDRTLFVLGRAIIIAAPAGLIIWLLSNITLGNLSLLIHCSNFLNPFAQLLGLDGVILLAFILGFPANEIVIPIIIMAYMSTGKLIELNNLVELKTLLIQNGWTWITAVSVMIFTLIHWPCSTTCLTIKKETGSWKWTLISILIPTIIGFLCCFIFTTIANFIN